jgi:hypothetical protein
MPLIASGPHPSQARYFLSDEKLLAAIASATVARTADSKGFSVSDGAACRNRKALFATDGARRVVCRADAVRMDALADKVSAPGGASAW